MSVDGRDDPAIAELRARSAAWGRDPLLIQGAGGNSSYKSAGLLTVKASGKRLADAEREDVFVTLPIEDGRAMMRGGRAPDTGVLRPSIETSLHAVMPHAFVAHFHAVEVMAYAVRQDAEAALARPLEGLNWAWLPYVKPGATLAQGIVALFDEGRPDIVVLGNHGIVVGAESCEDIDRLIVEVRRSIGTTPRGVAPSDADIEATGRALGLDPVRERAAHLAALHPANVSFAMQGSLYPDHVVFLGRGAAFADADAPDTLLRLVPGIGAFLPRGMPVDAHEMAACLGAVTARIADDAALRVLSRAEEDELIHWDAEAYRRQLAGLRPSR